jgi:hexosaminidase
MKKILSLLLLVTNIVGAQVQIAAPHIIPQPVSLQTSSGQFAITQKTVIAATDAEDRKAADYFNEYLQQVYGFKLDIDKQEGKNYIRLTTKKFIKAPDKDAYQLTVSKDGIAIEGDTYAGTFYGVQTMIQLLPTANNKVQTLPFHLSRSMITPDLNTVACTWMFAATSLLLLL